MLLTTTHRSMKRLATILLPWLTTIHSQKHSRSRDFARNASAFPRQDGEMRSGTARPTGKKVLHCAHCSFIAHTSDRLDLTSKQGHGGAVAIHVAPDHGLQPQSVLYKTELLHNFRKHRKAAESSGGITDSE